MEEPHSQSAADPSDEKKREKGRDKDARILFWGTVGVLVVREFSCDQRVVHSNPRTASSTTAVL